MLQVSALYIYPIKSLGGFAVDQALVTDRGLQHDRRWMLVDKAGNFLSQRSLPAMALLQTALTGGGIQVTHKQSKAQILLPFVPQTNNTLAVTVWDNRCIGIEVSPEASTWFSEQLALECRLVYMPDEAPIAVETAYAHNGEVTSFSDGYPFLLISQASLDDLNNRLEQPVPMNRFRPNIVVSGSEPYAEDGWQHFQINGLNFFGVKLCGRCVVTTINQDNLAMSKEPLKTLSTYRQAGNKIMFGQNLLHSGSGTIAVGQEVSIL
ncbi:hypothetical protein SAMN05444008_107149 [Cnuella takakiae]|uniref:MOSC domain-containing protein n=1 Tax=Cnuella takakiae TaxID=1302690 RepID=A0A1M5B5G1_9BACT|nr:MOSC N-terminal beta barrel domain-containing protein [Cnuella takakiae]OLY93344.1 MOSC domain-containing protein [Cnuella takakiae]SHF37719.1 hypothetical protein SAMN05444008_107149 [Cnuella takakiae]